MGLGQDRPANDNTHLDVEGTNGNAHTHRRYGSGSGEMALTHEEQTQALAERPRGAGRKPSERSKEQRLCGKCGTHLTGQFVRALGDTYHLECFTCHVSPLQSPTPLICTDICRTATKSWHPNSSQYPINRPISTRCVRQTTSDGSTCSALLAEAH
jgi:hypothetical protein